jgi:hypothetical protein
MESLLPSVRRRLLLAVATAALIGGVAFAATDPIGADGDVDACYKKRGGQLSLKVKKRCPRGTKSVSWAEVGPRGPQGADGAPGRSALDTLRSGETVRGAIGGQVNEAAGNEFYFTASLPVPAPEPLTDANVIAASDYEDTAGTCTGDYANPTAPPGIVCIYDSAGTPFGENTMEEEGTSLGGINGLASPLGFALRLYAVAPGETASYATWAYQAP